MVGQLTLRILKNFALPADWIAELTKHSNLAMAGQSHGRYGMAARRIIREITDPVLSEQRRQRNYDAPCEQYGAFLSAAVPTELLDSYFDYFMVTM